MRELFTHAVHSAKVIKITFAQCYITTKDEMKKKRTYLVRGGRAEDDDWTILLSFLLFSICFSLISGLLFSLFLFSVLLAAWFLPFCVCLLLPPGIVLCVFSFLFSFVCFYFSLQSPFCDLCIFLFFLFLCSSPFSPVLPSRFLFFRTAPSPSLYLLDLPLCFFFSFLLPCSLVQLEVKLLRW